MFLNDEYTKIDELTYIYYDKKTKKTVELIFRPKETAVAVDKKVIAILSKQYIDSQLHEIEREFQLSKSMSNEIHNDAMADNNQATNVFRYKNLK